MTDYEIINHLLEVVRGFKQNGTRQDLNPTKALGLPGVSDWQGPIMQAYLANEDFWHGYIKSADTNVRAAATSALEKVSKALLLRGIQ